MVTDSFLGEKWGILERAQKYVWKSLLNLDCQDFNIYQVTNK